MKLTNNKLTPSKGKHLKSMISNDIYEGCIYLGIYDSKDNYIEVDEEDYQSYLKAKEAEYNEYISKKVV